MQFNENLGNSIAKFFADYSAKEDVRKESSKLEFKTFYQKHKRLVKVLPFIHYGLFSVFSIGTAIFYLSDKVFSMLPIMELALILSFALLAIYEFLKSYLFSNLFQSWFYSVIHHGKGTANLFLGFACLLMLSGSVFLSVSGAKVAALKLADKSTLIQKQGNASLDSLNAVYASKISKYEQSIQKIEANKPKRWAGLLSNSENKQILNIQKRIDQTEDERKAAIKNASISITINANKSLSKAENTAIVIMCISLINESLIVVCVWFGWFYSYKVRKEKETLASNSQSVDTNYIEYLLRTMNVNGLSFANMETSGAGVIAQKPLGFDYVRNNNGERNTVNVGNKTCKNCGSSFEAKHWNAQYCGDACRIKSWEKRTGKKVRKGKK